MYNYAAKRKQELAKNVKKKKHCKIKAHIICVEHLIMLSFILNESKTVMWNKFSHNKS